MKVKKLVLSAVLSALAFVLYEFISISIPPTGKPFITLSLGIIPIFFIAYYCGAWYAASSAVIVDIMGYLLVGASKGYAFHPGYTLNAFISGLLFGLILKNKEKLSGKLGNLIIILVISITTIITVPIFYICFNKFGLGAKYDNEYIELIISILAVICNIFIIVYSLLLKNKEESNALNICFICYQIIVSLLLTPLWVYTQTKINYINYWTVRMASVPITTIIYSMITRLILAPIKKIADKKYK